VTVRLSDAVAAVGAADHDAVGRFAVAWVGTALDRGFGCVREVVFAGAAAEFEPFEDQLRPRDPAVLTRVLDCLPEGGGHADLQHRRRHPASVALTRVTARRFRPGRVRRECPDTPERNAVQRVTQTIDRVSRDRR